MTTLRDRIQAFRAPDGTCRACGAPDGMQHREECGVLGLVAWAYGEERECNPVGTGPNAVCTSCHGTGKTRTPGLVDRLTLGCTDTGDWALMTSRDALTAELGEETP